MRKLLALVTTLAMLLAAASPAFANHEHVLTTPGTTVQDIASGQTEKCADEPGGHKFHEYVHIGTPGTFAFAQGDQVVVDKTENATC